VAKLSSLPNISDVLEKKLEQAGIESADQLKEMGAEDAFIKLKTIDRLGACINMLYAIEGAMQGIRWHGLDPARKQELKEFYWKL